MNLVCFLLMSMNTLSAYFGYTLSIELQFQPSFVRLILSPLKKISRQHLFQTQTVICDSSGNI